MENEKKPKKSKLKLTLMIVIPIILITSMGLGYMVIAQKSFSDTFSDVMKVFEKEIEEMTMPLDEFLVNINSSAGKSRYLKIRFALMYNDAKHGEILIANVSRIRDIVISELRIKEIEEILDPAAADALKEKIREDINSSLDKDIVKDVYITDLIVQ